MAKPKRNEDSDEITSPMATETHPSAPSAPPREEAAEAEPRERPFDDVVAGSPERPRDCPFCWRNEQDTGNCNGSHLGTRYYKCRLCGHTWTALIKPAEVIAVIHRTVDLKTRDA